MIVELFAICYTRGCEKSPEKYFMKKITIDTELTQAQIADIMGVKQPQVSNWLNGKRLPTSQNLVKLANILNYYPEELLNDLVEIQKQNQA
jgi:transcriptional regulator with XRE-family HTH domain